jgi:hypothetical protein
MASRTQMASVLGNRPAEYRTDTEKAHRRLFEGFLREREAEGLA